MTKTISKQPQAAAAAEAPERLGDGTTYAPRVDIFEADDALVIQAEMPGAKADAVDVDMDDGVLSIRARVEPRPAAAQPLAWQEYGVGDYARAFTIGIPVDVAGIRAEMKNGVLTVHVPKAASAKTRRVRVAGS